MNEEPQINLLTQLVTASVVQRVIDEIFADPNRKEALLSAVAARAVEELVLKAFAPGGAGYSQVLEHLRRDANLVASIAEAVKERLDVSAIAVAIAGREMDEWRRRSGRY